MEVKEIKIKFYTNLESKEQKLVDFDLDMLYNETVTESETGGEATVSEINKSGLNKYPYFTMSVKYPLDRLQKDLMTYEERVRFFFDNKEFEKKLLLYTKGPTETSDIDLNNALAEHNVMAMIELLFPTKFTVIKHSHTSYDHVTDSNTFSKMWFNPTVKQYFSYLKLADGKIYTFVRLIWLNDLMNHPLYRTFINEFHTFTLWFDKEKTKLIKQMQQGLISLSKIVDYTLINIFRGIKQSFVYFDVQSELDDEVYSIHKSPLELIAVLTGLKVLLDKLKKTGVITQKRMLQVAIFDKNAKNMKGDDETNFKYFAKEIEKGIEDAINKIEKKEKILKDFAKRQAKDKEALESDIEELEDKKDKSEVDEAYIEISKYIEKHFSKDAITKLKLTGFLQLHESEQLQAGPEVVVPMLSKIHESVKEISVNPLKLPVTKLEKLNYYETLPMDEVEKNTSSPSPEYVTFMRNVKSRYYGTQRKSTNAYLQTLIDGQDENSIREFFKIFNLIYSMYMQNQPARLDVKIDELLQKTLKVSVSKINTNVSDWQYEIYIMADFIKGKVDDKNVNTIFCPYVGEYLGTMFEFLFQLALYGKSNQDDLLKWAVDRNRVFFSLESIKMKNGEVREQLEQKPISISVLAQGDGENSMKKFSSDVVINNQNERIIPVDEDVINSLFIQNVLSADPLIGGSNGIISKLQSYLPDVNEAKLLSYISKNNKKLYDIIIKWHSKQYTRDQNFLEEMIGLMPSFETKKSIVLSRLNDAQNVRDSKEKIELQAEYELNSLYSAILNKLIELEQKKATDSSSGSLPNISRFGGTRRKIKKSRGYTRRYKSKR